jgi:hypothetical protein
MGLDLNLEVKGHAIKTLLLLKYQMEFVILVVDTSKVPIIPVIMSRDATNVKFAKNI